MSNREWTKDELERVWPLDKHGFSWVWTHSGMGWVGWVASSDELVCYWRDGEMIDDGVPLEVKLAVVSVALGLDSREAIAAAIGERAKASRERSEDLSRGVNRFADLGAAIEAHDCAEMVRRGTVTP